MRLHSLSWLFLVSGQDLQSSPLTGGHLVEVSFDGGQVIRSNLTMIQAPVGLPRYPLHDFLGSHHFRIRTIVIIVLNMASTSLYHVLTA